MKTALNCLIATVLTFGLLFVPAPVRSDEPLNVLMIAVDDLNGWIGAMRGPAITPNMDRLAESGTLFTNAHSVVPACNPSRVALLTGQRPETTGQFSNAGNFRDLPGGAERITLPQFLAAQGYDTVAAGKIFHHPHGTGDEPRATSDPASWRTQRKGAVGTPGKDLYLGEDGIPTWHAGREFTSSYANTGIFWGPIPNDIEETGDFGTAEYCGDYLEQEHDKPFFLACGIFRPHNPLLAPQEFFDMYPLDQVPLPPAPADDFDDIPERAHANWSTEMTTYMKEIGEWPKAMQAYLASITFADHVIGLLLDRLDNSAYAENTVVVLWGDHGWHLGDKERMEKYSLWRGATNAPLIVRVPGKAPGATGASISFLDIYPTILAQLGHELPDYLEGNDFSVLLDDPAREWPHPAVTTYPAGNYSVKMGEWNYIRYEDGSEELYDMSADAWEHRNRVKEPEQASRLEAMRQHLPDTTVDNTPEGLHPSLDGSNSRWDGGAQSLTITKDVTFNPTGVENLDDVMDDFYWDVPESVKKVIIAKDVTVTGHFRLRSDGQSIWGEDRKTSVIFGTDTRAWARGPNQVEDEGTRCAGGGLAANVAGDDRAHDCEKWYYGAISPANGATDGARFTVKNLTIENARTYAITSFKQAWLIDRVNIVNTRPKPDWHSNSDGIGGGEGTVIRDTFIDTWDDSIKLYKDGFLVEDVTIVHNPNGSPFQLGWGDKPKTQHRLVDVKVKASTEFQGTKFNLPLFANSGGRVDALVSMEGVRAHYPSETRLNKCSADQPMPLVYLSHADSRLRLVAKEKDGMQLQAPELVCGDGPSNLQVEMP